MGFARLRTGQVPGRAEAFAAAAALAAAIGVGRFAFTPILPMMQEDAGLTVAQGGWLASANYAGYLAGAIWAMLQRARAARAIRTGLAAIAATTIGMGWVHGMGAWLALRFSAGVASAWVLIHVTSWAIARLASLDRRDLGGAVFSGVGVGMALAGGVCLYLMSAGFRPAAAWTVLGLATLAVWALVWPALGAGAGAGRESDAAAGRYSWDADGLRLVLCYAAFGFGYIIPATFVPAMARAVVADPAVFGWAWPVFGIGAAASTVLAAGLVRRWGNRRVWIASVVLMAAGVIAPLVIPGIAGIVAAALLVGGTFMVATMTGLQEARAVAGAHSRVLGAGMTAGFAAGQIVGPLLVSALAHRSGGFPEALSIAFVALAASALWLARDTRAYRA